MSASANPLSEQEQLTASLHDFDDTIQILSSALQEFRDDMERVDRVAGKISQRTNRVIRGAIVILVLAFSYVFVQVIQLTSTMVDMIGSMNTMYTRFGGMSEDMRQITQSVLSMGNNVQGMPQIAVYMKNMNQSVQGMQGSVLRMKEDVGRMDQEIGVINRDTYQMAVRFNNLTNSVSHLNHNVRQMSRPTDLLGPLNWFAPP
ncbi:MAG: hypothetical protein HQM04_13835 [Magnetococcales bacterium]|nr:hypothetical protein [Magnetococcales bacterium]MBF0116104.1 hypothetical protein [Magnetococcales bacterium]